MLNFLDLVTADVDIGHFGCSGFQRGVMGAFPPSLRVVRPKL